MRTHKVFEIEIGACCFVGFVKIIKISILNLLTFIRGCTLIISFLEYALTHYTFLQLFLFNRENERKKKWRWDKSWIRIIYGYKDINDEILIKIHSSENFFTSTKAIILGILLIWLTNQWHFPQTVKLLCRPEWWCIYSVYETSNLSVVVYRYRRKSLT